MAPDEKDSNEVLVTKFKGMITHMFKQLVEDTSNFQESTNSLLNKEVNS